MIEEELVDLVAEHIYNNYYRDNKTGIKTLEFYELDDKIKSIYKSMATNIITIVNDWYDLESEKEWEEVADEFEFEDPYGERHGNIKTENWWEL